MNKSKRSTLTTYLCFAILALISVASHFNFVENTASDILPLSQNTVSGADFAALDATVAKVETALSATFAPAPVAKATPRQPVIKARFTSISRSADPSEDAGTGIKLYKSLLYAHSTLAGAAFKALKVGDQFTATIDGQTTTYQVISRSVVARDDFNSDQMNGLTKSLVFNYSSGLSLMTCGDGANNDESYRLILFAKKLS